MGRGKATKKQQMTDIAKNVISYVEKLKANEKELTSEFQSLKVENVAEVKLAEDKDTCYLIHISAQDEKSLRKINALLVKKMEEHLAKPVVIIPAKKQINGKDYARYISKRVPRDRTLTAVYDSYLDDLLFPATIIGKRIRYPKGTTREFKVIVDHPDKVTIDYKIPSIVACYKALTNRELEIVEKK